MGMEKNPHAVALGKRGGAAKFAKHGVEQIRALGLSRRKPDDQVSKNALYQREYRERLKQAETIINNRIRQS